MPAEAPRGSSPPWLAGQLRHCPSFATCQAGQTWASSARPPFSALRAAAYEVLIACDALPDPAAPLAGLWLPAPPRAHARRPAAPGSRLLRKRGRCTTARPAPAASAGRARPPAPPGRAARAGARPPARRAPGPDPLAPAHVAPESGPHALAVCTALALAPADPRPQAQAPGAGNAGTPAAPPPGCALAGPNPNPSPGKQGRGAAPWAASPGRRRSCRRCRPSAPGAARPGASAGSAAHQAAAAQRSPAAPLHPPSQQRSEQLHCVAHCAQSA